MREAILTQLVAAALALSSAGLSLAFADQGVYGHWLVANGRAIIELKPCGTQVCGEIAWLARPETADGAPKRDAKNPDPSARLRPLCRLQLIQGLMRAGDGRYEGGEIYNTRDGRTYGVQMALDGPQTLKVRGFLGISLLGKTQEWRRLPNARGGCGAPPTQSRPVSN